MKYLFLVPEKKWNGSVRAVASAARELGRRGNDVYVVAEPETDVERVLSQRSVSSSSKSALYKLLSEQLNGFWFTTVSRVKRILRDNHIQIVYVHSLRQHFIAAIACRLYGRARVVRRLPPGERIPVPRRKRLGTSIAVRIAPSSLMFSAETDLKASGVSRKVVAYDVVLPGVSVVEEKPVRTSQYYIACVNDSLSKTSAATAIRVLATLIERHPDLRLIIVGEGPYEDDLRMQAAALRVLNLVTFVGERDDEIEVMRNARLGWVVAQGDTGAFAALDFMSLGVPVLAHQLSVSENYVLQGITGLLFYSSDPNVISASVAELLSSDETRATIGEAAQSRVIRDFTLVSMVDGYESIAKRTIHAPV